ncbi:MAG: hypothetical protein EBU88_14595, partial [Acidobacteria bacterium]|nr:hypothetical protein [Acidobacteriota bacterium]
GEIGLGLNILSVSAPAGTVNIRGTASVDVISLSAGGADGTVRATSTDGNLTIVQPATGDAVSYHRGIAFSAGRTLNTYRFFTAPGLMEYRGDEIIIGGVSDRLAIPASLEGETIILEQRNGIRLKNLISLKADRLELLSNRNVSIQTSGSILAELIVIRALGTEDVEATVYNPANGGTRTIVQPTGGRGTYAHGEISCWTLRPPQESIRLPAILEVCPTMCLRQV